MTGQTNGVNGFAGSRVLKPGIYAPIPSFFLPDSEDLGAPTPFALSRRALLISSCADLDSFSAHVVRLAKANVRPLVAGSMGEAIHLTHSERATLIKTARKALDDAGLHDVPVIAGTGTGSTRETIELCHEAAVAGADFVIVITSGYFAGALTRDALKAYFVEVAEKSPLPVIVYNCASALYLLARFAPNLAAQTRVPAAASTSTQTSSPSWRSNVPTSAVLSSRTSLPLDRAVWCS